MRCLLLLLFYSAFSILVLGEQRCVFDKISKNTGELPLLIIPEVPRKGQNTWRTYTANVQEWRPIRFKLSAEDLFISYKYCTAKGAVRPRFDGETAVCQERDVLTVQKRSVLLKELMPAALKLHSDRLLVEPVTFPIFVPRYIDGVCAAFTIPTDHHTKGVSGADMILYVAAGPTSGITAAWAATCSRGINNRPMVGIMNYGPHIIAMTHESIRAAAHEMAHALGFDVQLMGALKMLRLAPDIRGRRRIVVSAPITLSKVKAHFACGNLPGMEMENEGGEGTALSHWERRNAKDELMSGYSGTAGFYTSITMAAFADMRFYRVNWGMEEEMHWGNNSGCAFLYEKCMAHGHTRYPDMFCNRVGPSRCTSDLRGLGKCKILEYMRPLPLEYQYFEDPHLGGDVNALTDLCPHISPSSRTRCVDGDPGSMPGSRVGRDTLCLRGESLQLPWSNADAVGDICAEVACDKGDVRVRYSDDPQWYLCPEGSKLKAKGSFVSGFIVCPRKSDVCRRLEQMNKFKNHRIYAPTGGRNASYKPMFPFFGVVCSFSLLLLFHSMS